MDTIIFFLIFCAFLAMRSGKRWLVLSLFLLALLAMILLFKHHVTEPLRLNF